MDKKHHSSRNHRDVMQWFIAAILIGAVLLQSWFYPIYDTSLRAIVWVLTAAIVVLLLATTQRGRQIRVFCAEAKKELHKIVWPKRQETVRITLMVIVLVIIVTLILWAVDAMLLWVIGWLTGQRG